MLSVKGSLKTDLFRETDFYKEISGGTFKGFNDGRALLMP